MSSLSSGTVPRDLRSYNKALRYLAQQRQDGRLSLKQYQKVRAAILDELGGGFFQFDPMDDAPTVTRKSVQSSLIWLIGKEPREQLPRFRMIRFGLLCGLVVICFFVLGELSL